MRFMWSYDTTNCVKRYTLGHFPRTDRAGKAPEPLQQCGTSRRLVLRPEATAHPSYILNTTGIVLIEQRPPFIQPILFMIPAQTAFTAGAMLLLHAFTSAQDWAPLELHFEPKKAELSASSWTLLDGMGHALRQAESIDFSISIPKGFFVPDHGEDLYSRRLALLRRWITEENVDLARVAFRMVAVKQGVYRADAVVVYRGRGEAKYRPPLERDTTWMLENGIALRSAVKDAAALARAEAEGLPWDERSLANGWPATEVAGGQRTVVGLVQIHVPDSARDRAFRVRFPLPTSQNLRRAELMIPTERGLLPLDGRVRLDAEDGTTFAVFAAPAPGCIAVVAAAERATELEFVDVLAPDGWVFEGVAWRTAATWHDVKLGEAPHRARLPIGAVSEAHAYRFELRNEAGQRIAVPWMAWEALPWKHRPLPLLHRAGQLDADLWLLNSKNPETCQLQH